MHSAAKQSVMRENDRLRLIVRSSANPDPEAISKFSAATAIGPWSNLPVRQGLLGRAGSSPRTAIQSSQLLRPARARLGIASRERQLHERSQDLPLAREPAVRIGEDPQRLGTLAGGVEAERIDVGVARLVGRELGRPPQLRRPPGTASR